MGAGRMCRLRSGESANGLERTLGSSERKATKVVRQKPWGLWVQWLRANWVRWELESRLSGGKGYFFSMQNLLAYLCLKGVPFSNAGRGQLWVLLLGQ